MKKTIGFLFCLLIFSTPSPHLTIAATSKGILFNDTITIDGKKLLLHGIGLLKWKYLVDVYLVGLYKPENVPVSMLPAPVPMRLEYYFFVDMSASDFQNTGFQLMARNVGEEKTKRLTRELDTFNALYQDVTAGQRYTLTFMPGKGLEIALNEKVLGVVESDEFGPAYLSIWLGTDPVSPNLKKGLLDPSTTIK